jgi:hypothetical protein
LPGCKQQNASEQTNQFKKRANAHFFSKQVAIMLRHVIVVAVPLRIPSSVKANCLRQQNSNKIMKEVPQGQIKRAKSWVTKPKRAAPQGTGHAYGCSRSCPSRQKVHQLTPTTTLVTAENCHLSWETGHATMFHAR